MYTLAYDTDEGLGLYLGVTSFFSDMDIVGARNTLLISVVNSGSSYLFLHGDAWEPWMFGTHVQSESSTLWHVVLT